MDITEGFINPLAGLAAVAIGLYGLSVAMKGNSFELINLLKEDMLSSQGSSDLSSGLLNDNKRDGFIKWGIAIIIVISLSTIKPIRPFVLPFYGLIILAMLLHFGAEGNLFKSVSGIWNKL